MERDSAAKAEELRRHECHYQREQQQREQQQQQQQQEVEQEQEIEIKVIVSARNVLTRETAGNGCVHVDKFIH